VDFTALFIKSGNLQSSCDRNFASALSIVKFFMEEFEEEASRRTKMSHCWFHYVHDTFKFGLPVQTP
jgi:hypothetical protein